MGLALEKGSQVKFVEIEHNDRVKRFLLPDLNALEGRLAQLISGHPRLNLVRIGKAIVTSKDESNELKDGIEGIPSTVISNYLIDLCGNHPNINQGPARYSQELVQALANIEPHGYQEESLAEGQSSIYDFTAKQETKLVDLPIAPKVDLALSLRAQVEVQKNTTLQERLNAQIKQSNEKIAAIPEKEVEVISTPVSAHAEYKVEHLPAPIVDVPETKPDVQAELNLAMEKARLKRTETSRADIKLLTTRPQAKIDILLEKITGIEAVVNSTIKSEMTSKELSDWFYSHLDSIGHEKTFAILASRLKK